MSTRDGDDDPYRGRRVAVLGASGFIGRWVARNLCARGADVNLIVRNYRGAESIFSTVGVASTIYEQDLRDFPAVRELLRAIRPSITFNLAGYGVDPSERDESTTYQVNASLIDTICTAVAETRDPAWSGQDIVHVGSALEYGAARGDLSEDTPPFPTTLYGKSKLAGTELLGARCRADGIKGLTARIFTVYGPGEHEGRLLPSLLEAAALGRPLALSAGWQRRDFTYVEDVADGLLRLGLTRTLPGSVVNLATGRLTSVRDFAGTAGSVLQIPLDQLQFGLVPTRREEMDHLEVTIERLRQLLGWVPRTGIAEGIRRTVAFLEVCTSGGT